MRDGKSTLAFNRGGAKPYESRVILVNSLQEKVRSECPNKPYRKPTQVGR